MSKKVAEDIKEVKSAKKERVSVRGQGWCRIFTYYQPKLFAILMVITAGINALSFPILGYHLASLQIVLVKSDDDPNWIEERDQLLL